MPLKKKKKFIQRLQHSVCFDIGFDVRNENRDASKPLINFVQAGSVSDKKFIIGDLIISINKIKIKTVGDLDFEVNKIDWGDEVLFEVKRLNKIEQVKIKTISIENYQKNHVTWPCHIKVKNNLALIEKSAFEYPEFDRLVEDDDILLSIDSKKISSLFDFEKITSKYKPGKNVEFKIKKKDKSKEITIKIKLINGIKAIEISKKSCENHYLKKAGSLLFKEWVLSDYGANHLDWNERRKEIMQLETIAERFSNSRISSNSDYLKDWKNKDVKLLTSLLKPEYKDLNFKLNFFSLIFNSKIISKLQSLNLKKDCCYSFILTGKVINGNWDKDVPANIKNFEKLISVKDKKRELFIDEISKNTLNFFFNTMIEKKKNILIKYKANEKFWKFSNIKDAELSTALASGFESIATNLGYWFESRYKFNKAKIKLAVDDFCKSFFLEYPDFNLERIKEIEKMDLQDIPDYDEGFDSDYKDKTTISSYVKKEKVSGKDCFVVYYDSFPNTYEFEENSVFLKVYAFDVTDLDQKEYEDIYYETDDYEDNPKLDNYLRDNCNVIKTNNFDWSEGSSILVQKKLLNPNEDPPEKIAFPFSVMNFPKAGKRKIAFRSFICKKELKFHENEGRPLDYQIVNYRPEHFKLNEYQDHFDEYDSYPDILAYDASEIDAEYKQAGYLGVNRQKLDSLIIPLGFSIASINNDPQKSIQLVKDNIAFRGDQSLEGGINQTLNLRMIYEKSKYTAIDPQLFLKEIKNFSKIDERYEIINLLLNIATDDKTLTAAENKFLDDVAEKLELNQSKYLELKKIETASLKFVDFGDKADESIFGLSKDMDNKTKCKILRQEYSRWNSQTNNSNKDKRVRAKEMVNLIANLRKQYSC
ncbi:PDZ domain-containing protein [Candidatus Pelagibacter sp. HIMB1587]|uniref:PDZ domain-containing protein n=1 Tax=Candidatus Pelagibacter sp. HIMB1587 TaxID=3413354 RepID=UPI003F86D500